MTLNDVMAVILPYFIEFGYLPGVLRKSSRLLSYLLMSSCPPDTSLKLFFETLKFTIVFFQCFDAVGWVTGGASACENTFYKLFP